MVILLFRCMYIYAHEHTNKTVDVIRQRRSTQPMHNVKINNT